MKHTTNGLYEFVKNLPCQSKVGFSGLGIDALRKRCCWCGEIAPAGSPARRQAMRKNRRVILCGGCKRSLQLLCNHPYVKYWLHGFGGPWTSSERAIGRLNDLRERSDNYSGADTDDEDFEDVDEENKRWIRFLLYFPDMRRQDDWHGACIAALVLSPTDTITAMMSRDSLIDTVNYWWLRSVRRRMIKVKTAGPDEVPSSWAIGVPFASLLGRNRYMSIGSRGPISPESGAQYFGVGAKWL